MRKHLTDYLDSFNFSYRLFYSFVPLNYLYLFRYCIVFELAKVTKACRSDKDFYKMQKGEFY